MRQQHAGNPVVPGRHVCPPPAGPPPPAGRRPAPRLPRSRCACAPWCPYCRTAGLPCAARLASPALIGSDLRAGSRPAIHPANAISTSCTCGALFSQDSLTDATTQPRWRNCRKMRSVSSAPRARSGPAPTRSARRTCPRVVQRLLQGRLVLRAAAVLPGRIADGAAGDQLITVMGGDRLHIGHLVAGVLACDPMPATAGGSWFGGGCDQARSQP